MYGIYANIWGILMVNVTIYSIHGSYGIYIYIHIYVCQWYNNLNISELRWFWMILRRFPLPTCWPADHHLINYGVFVVRLFTKRRKRRKSVLPTPTLLWHLREYMKYVTNKNNKCLGGISAGLLKRIWIPLVDITCVSNVLYDCVCPVFPIILPHALILFGKLFMLQTDPWHQFLIYKFEPTVRPSCSGRRYEIRKAYCQQ